jgi:hypothetical protein
MHLKIGDWVTTCWSGIWRIYRILEYKRLNPFTNDEMVQAAIFSKRFLSKTFKRLFGEACCDPSYVSLLGSDDQQRLDAFIAANPSVYEKFETYQPKPVNCIYNASIGLPADRTAAELAASFDASRPLRDTDIDSVLTNMGLDTKAIPYFYIVQFVSKDHECIDDHLVFRFHRIFKA